MKSSRRNFLKTGVLTGIGISVAPTLTFGTVKNNDKVRIAFIGVGNRGRNHLNNFLRRDDVIIPAVCDTDQPVAGSGTFGRVDGSDRFPPGPVHVVFPQRRTLHLGAGRIVHRSDIHRQGVGEPRPSILGSEVHEPDGH